MMIDNMIIERVRNTDVIAFLEKYNCYTFRPMSGRYRCQQHESLAVKADRLSWYWHSQGVGGHGALDYLVKAEKMAFRDAVEVITGAILPTAPTRTRQAAEPPPKTLILPEAVGVPLRLYDYLSLAGTSDVALSFFLNQHKEVKELILCLDNDTAGREAAALIARKYAYKGYTVLNDLPRGKDFNEDLQALTAQIRAEKRTKPLHRDVEI